MTFDLIFRSPNPELKVTHGCTCNAFQYPTLVNYMTLYNEDSRIYMIDVDKTMDYLSICHIMLNMVI